MIEIKLEEASTLTLEMHIEGEVQKDQTQLRFSVVSEGVRYSFGSRRLEEGVYQIDFPKMLGRIDEGQYPAEVELMIDGKYFVPLEETVRFTKEIKPTVRIAESKAPVADAKVKVRMGVVERAPVVEAAPETIISDLKSLINTLGETTEDGRPQIDSAFALTCLDRLACGATYFDAKRSIRVVPSETLNEMEVVGAIRYIQRHGTAVEGEFLCDGLKMIKRANKALCETLLEKGVDARDLRGKGILKD